MKKLAHYTWYGVLIIGALYFSLDAIMDRPPWKEFGWPMFIVGIGIIAYGVYLINKNRKNHRAQKP